MSRSNYSTDCDDTLQYGRWRAQVASAIRGNRGQSFLKELAQAMDAMPEKVLIADALIDENGDCCTMGVVCKARGLDVVHVDEHDDEQVGNFIGIARQLAAEIAFENDENGGYHSGLPESPKQRWVRMRAWVASKIKGDKDE